MPLFGGGHNKSPRPVSSPLTYILTKCDVPHSRGQDTLCCGTSFFCYVGKSAAKLQIIA
nr:MAG TPA: hypothetical protein [Caudoviricetes sp.]